ncbi:MAG: LptF/LptG family permease, partial [Saprospiraceae bacterium]
MLKKIDLLLFRSFIPAFAISFVIALFVLTIQFLWLWLDELVGKGISLLVIAELISYLLLAFVPMSLPIGILISSVMLFGGLSEKYELSSLKSAGVPLLRIMKPLIFLTSGIALFSFFCSNNFIPVANLKSQTRLFDIKKQKPALNIEPGVFNDVFPGFSIRVGKKDEDNQHIEDVIVYEDQTSTNGKVNIIRAKKGVMYVSEDDRFFVMDLQDGQQYQEMSPKGSDQVNVPPFIRTRFKSYNKVFDLSAFAFTKSNEDLFKSNQSMLTSRQLIHAVDSINEKIVSIGVELGADLSRNMLMKDTNKVVKQDDEALLDPQRKDRFDSLRLRRKLAEE